MKNVMIVSYSVIAAIIGAGFASGQEILCYFSIFGKYGIIGILAATLLFVLFVFCVTTSCIKNRYETYDDFLNIFRHNSTRFITKAVTLVFSLAVYGTMLSALAESIFSAVGIPPRLGALLCTAASAVLFSKGTEKIFTANGIIGICLVFLITFSALYMIYYREFHVFSPMYSKPLESGLVYSGYNLISLTPVLITLSKKLKTKTDAISVSLIAGILTATIMLMIFALLCIYQNKIPLGQMPMLTLAKRQNNLFAALYTMVLSSAILTTLLSSGGGIVDALSLKGKPLSVALVSALAYFLSGLGFAELINNAYRLCGIAGFFVCVFTIYATVSSRENQGTNLRFLSFKRKFQ